MSVGMVEATRNINDSFNEIFSSRIFDDNMSAMKQTA
jgi:hypothetical protein